MNGLLRFDFNVPISQLKTIRIQEERPGPPSSNRACAKV